MLFSLIVPCYNEEGGVVPLFEAIHSTFGGQDFDYEIVFVNDGSTDGTLRSLRQLAAENPGVARAISFSRNFGKESALLAGLKHAKGDILCFIDADLQHPPETALEMLNKLRADEDLSCVCAIQTERSESRLTRLFKNGFYRLINALSDVNFVSGASDFRVFRRQIADALLSMTEYYRFSKGLFSWVGFKTEYYPYRATPRHSGETKWSFVGLLRYAIDGIFSFTAVPLRVAMFAGLVTSLLSVVYLLVVVVQKLFFSIDVPGYATIVTLILFFGGAQLFFIGIVGEYLARVFTQTKHRPPYIIQETINIQAEGEEA
ncbi:MAG: glycosyltransferase family 2 protein [Oscillospiraceae bacterium]|jgi:glycosyltransferase involved in cell wall biosynthesis|nr:glycosyltransferase family 2 protein [Oscillospiraceae bacterium]